jgi:hypothetical protein
VGKPNPDSSGEGGRRCRKSGRLGYGRRINGRQRREDEDEKVEAQSSN